MYNIQNLVPAAFSADLLLITALLGLVMGSFFNCLAWRLAHGEDPWRGRSHCPLCGHTLGIRDLVPVLSWLVLRGSCRYCGGRISPSCPLAELLTAAVYLSILLRWGPGWQGMAYGFLASLLLIAALVDWEVGLIPDGVVLTGIGGFVPLTVLAGGQWPQLLLCGLLSSLLVALPLFLLVLLADRLLGRETMGGGDIKLLFMLGLYFSWQLNLLLLITASVLGILLAVVLGRTRRGMTIPFGPALAAAAWLIMLWGRQTLDWYWRLFL